MDLRDRHGGASALVLVVAGALLLIGCGTAERQPSEKRGALSRNVADGDALVRATAPVISRGSGVSWLGLDGDVSRCGGNFPVAEFSAAGDIQVGAPSETAARQALQAAGMKTATADGAIVVKKGRATMTYRVIPMGGSSTVGRLLVDTPCTTGSGKTVEELQKRGSTDYAAELKLPR